MESERQIAVHRQRLVEKARRSNAKSVRLQKKIQREVKKRNPDMGKILNWQKRSARHVNKGLRYMNSFDALRKENHEETKILFNIEKVCFSCFSLIVHY